jgi:hypothetical protein
MCTRYLLVIIFLFLIVLQNPQQLISQTQTKNYQNLLSSTSPYRPTTLSNDFQVNENKGSCFQDQPAVGVDLKGNYIVVWEDFRNGRKEIFAQIYTNAGEKKGDNFQVNEFKPGLECSTPTLAVSD